MTGRIAILENDLHRLVTGWNQHLPQILTAVSQARQIAGQAELSLHDASEIKQTLAALTETIADIASRLERIEAEASRVAVGSK